MAHGSDGLIIDLIIRDTVGSLISSFLAKLTVAGSSGLILSTYGRTET